MSSTVTAAEREPSPLLKLPPELRSAIYRLVLVGSDDIRIHGGIDEPSLLRISKQIRQEACAIYYHENRFTIWTQDYDATDLIKWNEKVRAVRSRQEISQELISGSSIYFAGSPHWRNLLHWFQKHHERVDPSPLPTPSQLCSKYDATHEFMALGGMFLVVQAMSNQPWKDVEALMLEHRAVLAKIDSRWSEEK